MTSRPSAMSPSAARASTVATVVLIVCVVAWFALFVTTCIFASRLGLATSLGICFGSLAIAGCAVALTIARAVRFDRAERRIGYTTHDEPESGFELRDRRTGAVVRPGGAWPARGVPSAGGSEPIRGGVRASVPAPKVVRGLLRRHRSVVLLLGCVVAIVSVVPIVLWATELPDVGAAVFVIAASLLGGVGIAGIVFVIAFGANRIRTDALRRGSGLPNIWPVADSDGLVDAVFSLPAPGTRASDPTIRMPMYFGFDDRVVTLWCKRQRRFDELLEIPLARVREVRTGGDIAGRPGLATTIVVTANDGVHVTLVVRPRATGLRAIRESEKYADLLRRAAIDTRDRVAATDAWTRD